MFIFKSLCIFASFIIFFVLFLFWNFCQMNELSRSWVTSTFFFQIFFFFRVFEGKSSSSSSSSYIWTHFLLIFFVYRLELKNSSFLPRFWFFQTKQWLQIIFIFRSHCIFASFVIFFFVLVLFWNFFHMNELSRSWVTSTFLFFYPNIFFSLEFL